MDEPKSNVLAILDRRGRKPNYEFLVQVQHQPAPTWIHAAKLNGSDLNLFNETSWKRQKRRDQAKRYQYSFIYFNIESKKQLFSAGVTFRSDRLNSAG